MLCWGRRQFCFFLLVVLFQGLLSAAPLRIGVVYDGKGMERSPYALSLREEMQDLMGQEFELSIVESHGGFHLLSMRASLEEAYRNPEIDIVVPLGVLSSYVALTRDSYPKPTVVPHVFDDRVFKVPDDENLIYLESTRSIEAHLEAFKELVSYSKLAVVGDESLIDLEDFQLITEAMKKSAEGTGIELVFISVTNRPKYALDSIREQGCDAVMLLPTWRMYGKGFEALVRGINELKLPSYSVAGEYEVESGVLATITPKTHISKVARRIALDVQAIALSEPIDRTLFKFKVFSELVLNDTTAHAIEYSPTWRTLRKARLVKILGQPQEYLLNLRESVEWAIESNLDLKSQGYVVQSELEGVRESRSALLPQLNGIAVGVAIDADRARATGGIRPQYAAEGGLQITQRIYDEAAWADFDIQRSNYRAAGAFRDVRELDTIAACAIS